MEHGVLKTLSVKTCAVEEDVDLAKEMMTAQETFIVETCESLYLYKLTKRVAIACLKLYEV